MKTLIYNVNIYPDDKDVYRNGSLLIEDGRISAISREKMEVKDAESLDGQGMNLLPGYIDVHVHGGYGHDFLEEPAIAVETFSRNTVQEGCTAYLSSFISDQQNILIESMKRFAQLPQYPGAECLGIHMEGPFLSPARVAVMKPNTLREPSMQQFGEMIESSQGKIRQMTIAPELPEALELIEYGTQKQIKMMMGHSEANVAQAKRAIEKGAFGLTHMYNAMGQHEHRRPGLVTAGMLYDELICELITDGFHVDPAVLLVTFKFMKERIAIITDATLMRGLPDGEYEFSGHLVRKQGIHTTTVANGTLAGSAVTMDEAVRTFKKITDCTLNDIVLMASINPAKIAGCSGRKGQLKKGYDADLILLDDELRVKKTFVRGERVFGQE